MIRLFQKSGKTLETASHGNIRPFGFQFPSVLSSDKYPKRVVIFKTYCVGRTNETKNTLRWLQSDDHHETPWSLPFDQRRHGYLPGKAGKRCRPLSPPLYILLPGVTPLSTCSITETLAFNI